MKSNISLRCVELNIFLAKLARQFPFVPTAKIGSESCCCSIHRRYCYYYVQGWLTWLSICIQVQRIQVRDQLRRRRCRPWCNARSIPAPTSSRITAPATWSAPSVASSWATGSSTSAPSGERLAMRRAERTGLVSAGRRTRCSGAVTSPPWSALPGAPQGSTPPVIPFTRTGEASQARTGPWWTPSGQYPLCATESTWPRASVTEPTGSLQLK